MKKKVLFVIDSLNSGGAEKSLISLLSLFDYNQYDVDLITFVEGGLYVDLLHKEVNLLNAPTIFKEMKSSLKDLLINKELKKICWRIKSSIYVRYKMRFTKIKHGAQAMWPRLDKVIPNLDKEYDIAIAYSQGTPTYYVANKVKAKKKFCWVNIDYKFAKYNKDFDLKYYKKYENIIGVSEACSKVLIEVFPEFKNKIITIYDIISEKLIKDMSNNGEGFVDNFNGLKILTIGRLTYQKGYEFAIEAAKYLKEEGINFRWYAIGEGDLKEKLENMINEYGLEENFKLLGTFINPYPFIKQCDIYCQPSRFEGFGLAIAEARILNKPIVATNFDIVYDQLNNKENGIITEMNGKSVAEGIKLIYTNSKLKENLIKNLNNEKVGTEQELLKIYRIISGL